MSKCLCCGVDHEQECQRKEREVEKQGVYRLAHAVRNMDGVSRSYQIDLTAEAMVDLVKIPGFNPARFIRLALMD